jgi:hypothetical protein
MQADQQSTDTEHNSRQDLGAQALPVGDRDYAVS